MQLTVGIGVVLSTLTFSQCGGDGASEEASTPGLDTASATVSGDWPMYRYDLAATGYSPLDELTANNVSDLAEAWRYSLDAEAEGERGPNSQASPNLSASTLSVL